MVVAYFIVQTWGRSRGGGTPGLLSERIDITRGLGSKSFIARNRLRLVAAARLRSPGDRRTGFTDYPCRPAEAPTAFPGSSPSRERARSSRQAVSVFHLP